MTKETSALARGYVQSINSHDRATFNALFADGAVVINAERALIGSRGNGRKGHRRLPLSPPFSVTAAALPWRGSTAPLSEQRPAAAP